MVTAGTGPGQGWQQWHDRAVPMLHSLQQLAATAQRGWEQGARPPHMASGEKQDKAQASAHLTAWQEDREKCGVGAGSPGIYPQPLLPLQGRGPAHRPSPVCFEFQVCSLQRKAGFTQGRWGRNPAPLIPKKKRAFLLPRQLCQVFLQGLGPPQLHRPVHPESRAAAGLTEHNPPSRSLEKNYTSILKLTNCNFSPKIHFPYTSIIHRNKKKQCT